MLLVRDPLPPSGHLTIEQSTGLGDFRLKSRLQELDDLTFAKSVRAVASRGGFGRFPGDPRRQITICVWRDQDAADRYRDSDLSPRIGADWSSALEVVRTRGDHDGLAPLTAVGEASEGPVAVLTLGRTAWRSLPRFAAHGSRLRAPLTSSKGLLFATSAGWPISGNMTFSVWTSESAMLDFAYRNQNEHARTASAYPPILTGQLNARMRIRATRGLNF